MLALINPDEKIYDKDSNILGSRVCYFYDEQFDVAEPLLFIDTSYSFDDKDPQFFYYDEADQTVKYIPEEHLSKALTNPEPPQSATLTNEDMIKKLLEEKLKEYGINISNANTTITT
jgi:hypothetical protein